MSAWPEAMYVKEELEDYIDLYHRVQDMKPRRYIIDKAELDSTPSIQVVGNKLQFIDNVDGEELNTAKLHPLHWGNYPFADSSLWLITD